MSNVTKLTTSNYLMWSRQVQTLLDGYDLVPFLDPATAKPDSTIITNGVTTANPAFTIWKRQDKLIYITLLGAISTSVQPLLSRASTDADIWTTLTTTYTNLSRGHIRQLKQQLDESHEDQIDYILGGHPEDYKSIVDQTEARDTPPTLPELHEKLLNHEVKLLASAPAAPPSFPISANFTNHHRRPFSKFNNHHPVQSQSTWHNSPQNDNRRSPRPYLGRYQICGTQGHSTKRCPQFQSP
ncbi:PREDICTED: uncharacterized protein LOC104753189 [Camelina sativa]|uniref:Uncharacterized protein LOC104753189 n=1 Tax=Camelina sativa TaxID=90675 RepID=A0ABM0WNS0_CAMSA|nr:PREDICTED: uncharacterized protein LOC104753189 [Camelina sativa]